MKNLFKTLLLIINITIVLALMVSAFGGHVSPLISSLPGIALMLLPAIVPATVLILIADLLLWRRLAFLPAFALLLCASPIWNLCPLNISHNRVLEGHRELKVLTYNVCNFRYNDQSVNGEHNYILGAILDADADIVCLQENTPGDLNNWPHYRSQADSLADRYPYRLALSTKGSQPLAVWSRYPLSAVELPQPESPSAYFQCVNVMIDSVPLTLYNIHLQSIGLTPEDKRLYGSLTRRVTSRKLENARHGFLSKLSHAMKERARQAIMLREAIDSIGGDNIIVAGDFNDISDCWSQRTIMGRDLSSAFTSVAVGPTVTYNANRFYFNIDHLLYSRPIEAISYDRIKCRASDHYPVLVTLSYPAR